MKAFHYDEAGMIPRDKPDQDKGKDKKSGDGKGGANRMLPAFLPGQKGALAGQLNAGFGGGRQAWRQNLGATYAPFRNAAMFPYANLGGGNNDKQSGVGQQQVVVRTTPNGTQQIVPVEEIIRYGGRT